MRGRIPDDGRRVRDVRCKSAFTERRDKGTSLGDFFKQRAAVVPRRAEIIACFFCKVQKRFREGGKVVGIVHRYQLLLEVL